MIVFDAIQDEEMTTRSCSKPTLQQTSIVQYGYSEDVRLRFNWLKFVVDGGLPFSVVENEVFRNAVKFNPISRKTLVKTMEKTWEIHCEVIKEELPEKFGIIFDGWTCDYTNTHYVAVFAVYLAEGALCLESGNRVSYQSKVLLAIAPLLNEADYSAESHAEYILSTLKAYGRDIRDVLFVIGDNCSTNLKMARENLQKDALTGKISVPIPFIGCASHRLNLAVKSIYDGEGDNEVENGNSISELIGSVQEIMKKLRSLKLRSHLREKTDLAPVIRNKTRWSSTANMIFRFLKLEELRAIPYHADESLKRMALNAGQMHDLAELADVFRDLEKATRYLQTDDFRECNLASVRCVFDGLLRKYGHRFPKFHHYLALEAKVIAPVYLPLETGLTKIFNNQIDQMEPAEVEACRRFEEERGDESSESDSEDDIVALARKRARFGNSGGSSKTKYIPVHWIPHSSNDVERLFSRCKLTLGSLRTSMSPTHFEQVIMLYTNESLWSISTVNKAVQRLRDSTTPTQSSIGSARPTPDIDAYAFAFDEL
jgi:hypothetical protein